MSELTLKMWRDDMKKPKVKTGVFIDAITPRVSHITYPNGETEIMYEPWTLEDLDNHERYNEWLKNQLVANRGTK